MLACEPTLRQFIVDALFLGYPTGTSRLLSGEKPPGRLLAPGTGGKTPRAAATGWAESKSPLAQCAFATTSYFALQMMGLPSSAPKNAKSYTPKERTSYETAVITGDERAIRFNEDNFPDLAVLPRGARTLVAVTAVKVTKNTANSASMDVTTKLSGFEGPVTSTASVEATKIDGRWYITSADTTW